MPQPEPNADGLADDVAVGAWRVRFLDEVDSTNRCLLDAARRGEAPGLVVVARHQAAGRGREGRSWVAAPGTSLLASVLVEVPEASVSTVPLAAGLALAEAVEAVAGIRVALKWPNDLLVEGRKLAGVLCESVATQAGATRVVVGVGCNVTQRELPTAIATAATSIAIASGHPADIELLLTTFLDRFARRLDAPDSVVSSVRLRLATIGRRIRVDRVAGSLVGDAIDVRDDGALLVRDATGRVHTVFAGDVVHLRDDPPVELP